MSEDKTYPEHEKMKAVKAECGIIGDFLTHIVDKGLGLIHFGEDKASAINIETLLAEYYDVDLDVIEDEKKDMFDEIRKFTS